MTRRVLLIGRGPRPGQDERHTGFAQLRTAHFEAGLRTVGHGVGVCALRTLLLGERQGPPLRGWEGTLEIVEEGPGWIEQGRAAAEGADVIVSAGPYNPGRLACLVADGRPVWADLPGDPFAELQALADHGPLSTERRAAAASAALLVYRRADAISTVSTRQADAALGALGAVGRRGLAGPQVGVHSVPIAFDFPHPRLPPRPRHPGDPLCLALAGAMNPWFDDETLIEGLDHALAADRRISLLALGGPVPGLSGDRWARFSRWAARWPGRVELQPWVSNAALPGLLGRAHVGLSLDRPGPEPRLGSRTRLLLFAWLGLDGLTTGLTELVDDAAPHLIVVPPRDPLALRDALLQRADAAGPGSAAAAAAHFERRYAPQPLLAPLRAWIEAPHRAAILDEDPLLIEIARLRDERSRWRASPTWRLLSLAHRGARRLERRVSGRSPAGDEGDGI